MDNGLLKPLAEKIDSYEVKLKDLYEKKANIERAITVNETFLNHYRAVYNAEKGRPLKESEPLFTKRMTIAEAAEFLLREEGQPLRAAEIARRIKHRNLAQLTSKNPVSTVISILRRKTEKVDALGEGMYMVRID